MRLYPPAWGTTRDARADDEIGGQRIPGGSVVAVTPWVTHRHPEFWEDPERFDPERFTPERSAGRPEYAYFPFGGGPCGCIGRQFAIMEGQLALAMIARRFRVVLVPGQRITPHPIFTLRPHPRMLVRLERRVH